MVLNSFSMRVLKREEVWIHTHFVLDSKELGLKERERIKLEMEGFLRNLNIVFGIRFKEGETLRVILECIPEKEKLDRIQEKLNELLEPLKPKPKTVKVKVEGEAHGD